MTCQYCGSETKKDAVRCSKCGGPIQEAENIRRSNPFFYNGYIVYGLHDFSRDLFSWQFWLGVTLVDTIKLTRDMISEHIPEGCDAMPFIWQLFEVSQGKQEVFIYTETNKSYPARFEVRRIENEEERAHKERIRELLNI